MVYVKKITVDNYDEFLKMALYQKFTMAQDIVETVLENLNTRKKEIPVFEIEVESEDSIYTLSVQKDEFIEHVGSLEEPRNPHFLQKYVVFDAS